MNTDERDVTTPRPNPGSPYRCGLERMGVGCIQGPTASGQCCQYKSLHACHGNSGNGCTQQCTSSVRCEVAALKRAGMDGVREDLRPCIPIKTAWFSRQAMALNIAILVGGLLLVCMAIPQREAIFVPGGLSAKHSQILGNTLISERCSLCHSASHGGLAVQSQDVLCMNCHQSHMPDAIHRVPHDLSDLQFASLVATNRDGFAVKTPALKPSKIETSCASCHVEHQGGSHNLKAITDSRCQACHERQFKSFSEGHPEFDQFPYRTERRIAFDHRAHQEKYFSQKSTDFNCQSCHVNSGNEQSPISRSVKFEQACAGCHNESMQASMVDGWVLLQLPSLEPDHLGIELSDWPSNAQYGFDGPISLPMRLLLSSDPEASAALSTMGADSLSQVRANDVQAVSAAQTIAREVRELLNEIALEGQAAWQSRLRLVAERELGRTLTTAEEQLVRDLVSGLPPDLFRKIRSDWFGQSPEIVASRNAVPVQLVRSQELLVDDWDLLEGENVDELLNSSSTDFKAPAGEAYNSSGAPLQEQDRTSGELLGLSSGDELLDASDVDDLLGQASDGLQPRTQPNSETQNKKFTSLSGAVHLTSGGWYLDSQLLAVRYMPRGHADPILAAWVQFATLIDSAAESRAEQSSMKSSLLSHSSAMLPGKIVIGGCTECHLVATDPSVVSHSSIWRSVTRPVDAKLFTRFDHRPHLTLAAIRDCQHCHQLDGTGSDRVRSILAMRTQPNGNPATFAEIMGQAKQNLHHEFSNMEKSQCNTCHRPGSAADGCTQCHNYHVGTTGWEVMTQHQR